MPEEIKIADVHEALKTLRAEVEKSAPAQEVITKCNDFLDKQEEINQKSMQELKDSETRQTEMKERMEALEIELARASGPGQAKDYHDSEEYKALEMMVKHGEVDAEQKALLRTDNDTAGGYLTTGEMDNMITKGITEISPIRSIARVRTISSKSLEMPVRSSIPSAAYEGEAEQGGDSASAYNNETLSTFRQTFTVPITMDMLMDASFNMEAEIFSDSMEAFAKGEGLNFVLGDGVKKPSGFAADARVQANARTSTSSGTIDAEDVIKLTGDLKVGYNPAYVMNRTTLAFLRTLKSTTGSFLWQPGMNGPVANTINGFGYVLAQDMPDIASNSYSIAFGDFQRGYTIVDRTGISIVRDELTLKKKAIVEFTMNRWNYGQVTLPEAIKLLKTKA